MNPAVILTIVDTVLATLPKVGVGLEQAKGLYALLQGVFGHEVLPDKNDAEIAQLGLEGFASLKERVAAARASLG